MDSITLRVWLNLGPAFITVLVISATPETYTRSGTPSTVPKIAMATEEPARADVLPPSRPPSIATSSAITVRTNIGRRVFMSQPPFVISEGVLEDFGRRFEGHALWPRNRRRQRPHERRPVVVDLPPQQHGVVLVRGVVAVLHEHPGEIPELQRDLDFSVWAKPPDVLAAPLPRGDLAGASVAGEGLALLEVDVDRVIPAAAAVFQGPDLSFPEARTCRDPAEIGGEHRPVVRLDAPRASGRRDGVSARLVGAVSELEGPLLS